MKRKILSVTLSLALVFGSLLVSSNMGKSSALDYDNWNSISGHDMYNTPIFEHADFSPFIDSAGTSDDPYVISTAAQLAAVSVISNYYEEDEEEKILLDKNNNECKADDFEDRYLVVSEDIDICNYYWTPIGKEESFKGNIDFEGHTVYGLKMDVDEIVHLNLGLFGESEGYISHLTMDSSDKIELVSNRICFGSIVSYNKGSVYDCTNEMDIEINAESEAVVGGIVGCNDSEKGHIENCINKGTISAASFDNEIIGGIVGVVAGGSVSYCKNEGSVISDNFKSPKEGEVFCSNKKTHIGGIAGALKDSSATISNCLNSGGLSYALTINEIRCGEIVGCGDCSGVIGCSYLNRSSSTMLFVFSETEFFKMIEVTGIGSDPGVNLHGSTEGVDFETFLNIEEELGL